MKQPTLEEFIAAYGTRKYMPNLYVREKGFKQIYVRITPRWIDGAWRDPTLDLANIEATYPGKGTFTRLVERLRREHPAMTLFVESVLNRRFHAKLESLGFTRVGQDCFVIVAEKKLLTVSTQASSNAASEM